MRISLNQTHSGPPAHHLKMMKTKKTEWAGVKGSAKKRRPREVPSLNLPNPRTDVAGVDIGAREIACCVPAGRAPQQVRTFATFTADLNAAVQWFVQCRVRSVAMESTGLYWLGLAQLLSEAGIEVILVNARHVRHLPGRKSDVLDCQWLQYLHSVGLLRGSFRPADHLCALRSLTRHRDSLVSQAADQVRHAQKALTQMNLQLHHVIDDLTGATGSAIVEAILAGERDPLALAKLRNPNIKASTETVAKSLHGHWREEHLLVLRLAWETHAHYRMQITTLETEIHRRTLQLQKIAGTADDEQPPAAPEGDHVPAPQVPAPQKRKGGKSKNQPILSESLRASYQRIFGCDLTRIPSINILTVQALLSEVGPDLSAFPTASAFASWAGLCPGTKISGGRALSTRSRPGKPRIAKMLRQSALGLHRSASALGERYRRLRTRLGAPKALTAMAHMILRIIYKLVREGLEYDDSIYAKIEAENRKNRVHRLEANAKNLGYRLLPLDSTCAHNEALAT